MKMDDPFQADLSPDEEMILSDQVIDDKAPGTILTDFETLLEFIGSDGIVVSPRFNHLSMKLLPELNARMAQPIEIDLKRPKQKSYPNINGLYLLLRMTGLAILKGRGKKQILAIDDAVLDSWKSLNLTERYFTLLEAWLIKGRPEIIDEDTGGYKVLFMEWSEFFNRIKKNGLKIKGNKDLESMISYLPGHYAIALMDLFGLISVRYSKPEKGKGWCVDKVHRTPLGDALRKLLSDYFWSGDFFSVYRSEASVGFGLLQEIVRPFFPEWRNNLVLPEREFQDGTYVFKVSLEEAWRRIAIPGSMFFDDLSTCILRVFAFDSDHLYQFSFKNRFGFLKFVNHPYMEEESPSTDETRIGDAMIEPGAEMTFLFDFGDNWEFDVELERLDPVDQDMDGPRILDTYGQPPEQYPDYEEYEE
jgi:hypothetical protein